jgi:uncharacterized protein with HEPN domain
MSRDKQRLHIYLGHIQQAIEKIQRYAPGTDREAFMANEMVQDAVIRNFEIIGEASYKIEKHYPAFVASHPELPVSDAYQIRNVLAHGYYKVDLQVVWETVTNDLPALLGLVRALRSAPELAEEGIDDGTPPKRAASKDGNAQ